jgi:ATP-dependent exoDNAse (exonuclease V) alpha subunit
MLFLHSNGVGTSRAVRIYKTYGVDAVQLISENPTGWPATSAASGFRTADQIAAKLGIEKTALIRVRAGISYATTIHKSQGSEYPAVVIPLTTQHYVMLQRNLVYTGVTRGKRLVVLVGQRKALAIAVKGARARRRWSKLQEWLAA